MRHRIDRNRQSNLCVACNGLAPPLPYARAHVLLKRQPSLPDTEPKPPVTPHSSRPPSSQPEQEEMD